MDNNDATKVLIHIITKLQVKCALIDYHGEDAITIYMKHSMIANHQLDYDKGKY